MILSHSRKFVFVHIHKTAGEAITRALLPHLGRNDLVLGGSKLGTLRHLHYRRRHGVAKHSNARRLRAFLGAAAWSEYLSFAFVRHPVERMLSLYAYYEKMDVRSREFSLQNAAYTLPWLRSGAPREWPGMKAYREAGCFSEFIRHPGLYDDPGARPQFDMVSEDGSVIVQRIGRFESLAEDFRDICETLSIRDAPLARINPSRNSETSLPVSSDDREHLYRQYEMDFTSFGYV